MAPQFTLENKSNLDFKNKMMIKPNFLTPQKKHTLMYYVDDYPCHNQFLPIGDHTDLTPRALNVIRYGNCVHYTPNTLLK